MRVWNLSKKGQYFYTVDTEEEQQAQHVCLEYTMPRIEKGDSYKRMDSQEYENRPSLEHKKVCYHDDRYSIEVQIPSLFGDSSASWVGIVNGVDKNVTESMLTKKDKDIASVKPIAKARPWQKPTVTLTSGSIPVLEREWIDIEHKDHTITSVMKFQKAMTRLLRHDQSVPRGSDGAIQYNDIIVECRKKFDGASQVSLVDWISALAKGGRANKRFQYFGNPIFPINSSSFEHFKDIQEITLLFLHCKTMHYYRKDLPSTSTTSGTRVQ